jgi:YidC/Oxa1 family membrane protein insertase
MERRLILCIVLSFLILTGYSWVMQKWYPPKQRPVAAGKAADKEKGKEAQKGKDKEEEKGKQKEAKEDEGKKKAPPDEGKAKKAALAPKKGAAEAAVMRAAPKAPAAAMPQEPEQWGTLGSAAVDGQYRMLVTWTNRGAAVARIELSSSRYCDIDDRSGYLGHLVMDSPAGAGGCRVQVVGPGTPAAEAGIQPGDILKSVANFPVADRDSLNAALKKTKPGKTVSVTFLRGKAQHTKDVALRRRPVEVVRPEADDPLSTLLTLDRVDDLTVAGQWARDVAIYRLHDDVKLGDEEIAALTFDDLKLSKDESKIRLPAEAQQERKWVEVSEKVHSALSDWQTQRGNEAGPLFTAMPWTKAAEPLAASEIHRIITHIRAEEQSPGQPGLAAELDGANLRRGTWKVVSAKQDHVVFRRELPQWGLSVAKTYRLEKAPDDAANNGNYPAYHLALEIEIRNIDSHVHKAAYRLDGPTGLPTEGSWYTSRVTRSGGSGIRDFVISAGKASETVGAMALAADKVPKPWPEKAPQLLDYIGVDTQYFSAVLLPERHDSAEAWFDAMMPLRVGKADPKHTKLTDTSCRLVSVVEELKPGGAMTHRFKLFAGPKKTAVLDQYGLGDLEYFGWPIYEWPAKFLTWVLHLFYAVTCNYGLAIILLTVLVRGCLFPLSLRQAHSAQKMQMLQPELKKLTEKYKNNAEGRAKAQQELFRKHNCHPLGGCLPMFFQLPIFIGLYRALSVAIELRDAPLISNAFGWCSNLSAPDMLFDWSRFMPAWVNSGYSGDGMGSMIAPGPYFNLLPIIASALMIWQQKKMMPPSADEQAAQTQKVMKYMMVLMGFMFFKVASGLCLYFIATTFWGMGERRFLPKTAPAATGAPETRAEVKALARQAAQGKK